MASAPILAFDVGGSFVKAGLVDAGADRLTGEILRRATPANAAPEAVMDLLAAMARELPSDGPVGLAFPAVAQRGYARTAANIDQRWIGTDARGLLEARLGRPVAFLNDADAAGIAEMTLGAGRGRDGTVMVLTLGTGIGTALFVDGRLLPNTELGHLEVRGEEAEHRASARVRVDRNLDWPEWAAAVNEVLEANSADYAKYPPIQGTPAWQQAVAGWLERRRLNSPPALYHIPPKRSAARDCNPTPWRPSERACGAAGLRLPILPRVTSLRFRTPLRPVCRQAGRGDRW